MNALMAIAMAQIFGTPTEAIALALASFKGVKRRFSYQKKKRVWFILTICASSNRD
jgi:UDP-N-acetylmuramate--alanine ligase